MRWKRDLCFQDMQSDLGDDAYYDMLFSNEPELMRVFVQGAQSKSYCGIGKCNATCVAFCRV
jgi:hypothetical protein